MCCLKKVFIASSIGLFFFSHSAVPHGNEKHDVSAPPPLEAESTDDLGNEIIQAPDQIGHWGPVDWNWPVLAVHATLLPNGKVLVWDATPDDFDLDINTHESLNTRVSLWTPPPSLNSFGQHISTENRTGTDLFCAGSAHLWDGRVLFSGGDTGPNNTNAPSIHSNIYDYTNNTWMRADDMETPRWYSSVVALSNGEMLTFGGTYGPKPYAELFGLDKLWHAMVFGAPYPDTTGDYQWAQIGPNGNIFVFGPHQDIMEISTINGGQQNFVAKREITNPLYRSYGSYAMFDSKRGHVLIAGGGKTDDTPNSTDRTIITKLNRTNPDDWHSQVYVTSEEVSPMNYGRRQLNLTILADQSVLATGGHIAGNNLINLNEQLQANRAELWNPETKEWSLLGLAQRSRQYHSIAILLPDATVLTSGGGYCGDCNQFGYYENNAEIFYPPYLFEPGSQNISQDRPLITNLPQNQETNHFKVDYKTEFSVSSNQVDRIKKVTLIKLGSVTHSQNQDQRAMALDFTVKGNQLAVMSPPHRHIAPPGHYMMFIINEKGIPSVAQIIQVGQPLLYSGQLLVDRVLEQKWNYYKIKKNNLKAVKVTLNNTAGNARVFIASGQFPTAEINDCYYEIDEANRQICVAENDTNQDWYIGVYGNSRTEFNLIADNLQFYEFPPEESITEVESEEGAPSFDHLFGMMYDAEHSHDKLNTVSISGYENELKVYLSLGDCGAGLEKEMDQAIGIWNSISNSALRISKNNSVSISDLDTYIYNFDSGLVISCSKDMSALGRNENLSFGLANAMDSNNDGKIDKSRIVLNNQENAPLNYFNQTTEIRKKVLVHFLGHALGLAHNTDTLSLMNETLNDISLIPSNSDIERFQQMYGGKDQSSDQGGSGCGLTSTSGPSSPSPISLILLFAPLMVLIFVRRFTEGDI